ncbi:MAG: carcinine hydrolase/isopenicillin-N N-acyltransferase family protein [Candidatus Hodarchaeales archaeon]|jgi:hypothetical protein
MGCTTGAKILDDGKLVVFKNKDFRFGNHSDSLSMEHSHAFGVRGVNLGNQEMAGLSIGINHHGLVAVNSNVLATSDLPYDLITERIVLEARTVDDAIKICEKEVQETTKYQWCNMVIATPKQIVAIETTSRDMTSTSSNDYMVRTNHQLLLNTNDDIIAANPKNGHQKIKNSEIRYNDAKRVLEDASQVEDILSLLESHDQEAAICRHGQITTQDLSFNTVYSYIVTVQVKSQFKIFFDVVKGSPCKKAYTRLELHFPLEATNREQIHANYPF